MPTRVSLRRVGSLTKKLAALPDSRAALLQLATTKFKLTSPATRIFTANGEELDDDDDVLLLRDDEAVYISCGEDFSPPAAAFTPALDMPEKSTETNADTPVRSTEPRCAAPKPPPPSTQPPPPSAQCTQCPRLRSVGWRSERSEAGGSFTEA